jgi:hypothetical protein
MSSPPHLAASSVHLLGLLYHATTMKSTWEYNGMVVSYLVKAQTGKSPLILSWGVVSVIMIAFYSTGFKEVKHVLMIDALN